MPFTFNPFTSNFDYYQSGSAGAGDMTKAVYDPANIAQQLVGTSATQALTNKTYNGNTWTAGTGTLTIAAAKTLTVSNNITIAGTDGKSLTLTAGLTVTTNDGTIAFSGAGLTLTVAAAASVSGTNTGDQTTVSGNAGTATALQNARTIWGQSFDGTANITGAQTGLTTMTGGANNMTITAGTGNSRTLTLQSTTSGGVATNGLVIDAAQHITLEGVTSTGATGTGKFVFDGSPTLVTPVLGVATATTINKVTITTPASGSTLTIIDGKTLTVNNSIQLSGTDSTTMTFPSTNATIARTDAAQTFTGSQTFASVIETNNAIAASGNAATVPVTSSVSTVTNNSAATLTITITTTSAVNRQKLTVCILDASAVAQTITWVNTENSSIAAPTTSNGSTTLPLTVAFMYNSATSKWRCIGYA